MELVQVNWDEKKNLFLKFKKEDQEISFIRPENVKKVNVQFSISRDINRENCNTLPPFLNSVKNVFFSESIMAFSIELDELINIEDLQINFVRIVIFLHTGQKEIISIGREFNFSEIAFDDSCYTNLIENKFNRKSKAKIRYHQKVPQRKKVIDISKSVKSNYVHDSRDSEEDKISIPISLSEYDEWRKIKGNKSWTNTFFKIREGFERLQSIEQELKEVNSTLREIALKNATALANPVQYVTSSPQLHPPPNINPPSSIKPTRTLSKSPSINPAQRPNVLPSLTQGSKVNQVDIIREMKEKFSKFKNVKEMLSKVPKEELKREIPRTNQLAFLEFKEGKSEKKTKKKLRKRKKRSR